MLKSLHLRNVGPAKEFDLEFGKRLNVLTGDNGLGKSLLLDVAWWVLAGDWPDGPAIPNGFTSASHHRWDNPNAPNDGSISAVIAQFIGRSLEVQYAFDPFAGDWLVKKAKKLNNGLTIYARLDGGFSISDPALPESSYIEARHRGRVSPVHFSREEIWYGKRERDESNREFTVCKGLVEDWLAWEIRDPEYFQILAGVLEHLSAPGEVIRPARKTIRLPGPDVSEKPAIETPYGIIPITHASAGVKRILALAYALVWAWREREIKLLQNQGAGSHNRRIIVIADEVEGHLHPKWQRSLVPALLSVGGRLGGEADIQHLVSTHSPLVLASLETAFDEDSDRLFHLKLEQGEVSLQREEWYRRGDASRWLTSDIFNLGEARSIPAEEAISKANSIMQAGIVQHPDIDALKAADEALRQTLPSMDHVWARWSAFKSRLADRGVTI